MKLWNFSRVAGGKLFASSHNQRACRLLLQLGRLKVIEPKIAYNSTNCIWPSVVGWYFTLATHLFFRLNLIA